MSDLSILDNLPSALIYLKEPAWRLGTLQFDDQVQQFIDDLGDNDFSELRQIADTIRVNRHLDFINSFIDEYPMKAHEGSARLYFFVNLLTSLGLELEESRQVDLQALIAELSLNGNEKDAVNRMWAVRRIAELDIDSDTELALPCLNQALSDPDLRVRVWAHYAIARITGEKHGHLRAIEAIYDQHSTRDCLDLLDEIGAEAEAALELLQA